MEGTNRTCAHQDPGERSSDPTRDRPRFAHERKGVSGRGVGRQWPAAGLRALSVVVRAWDFITSTTVWPQVNNRLQQYVNRELPDVQAGFRKGRGTRDQIANIHWIIEKAREFQKNIYFCFIDHAKAFDYVDHNKLWKIPKEMGIPDHLIRLLRDLYSGQEATVRTGHGTTDWFQIRKGVH